MKRVKKLLGLFLAMSLFTSTAFANTQTVRSIVRDYQVDVRVNNVDSQIALKKLTNQLLQANISHTDLMDYIRSTSSPQEFEQFLAIIEDGSEELSTAEYIDANAFGQVLGKVFANTHLNTGASYNGGGQQGCSSKYFGYVMIAASVYLAIRLVQRRAGDYDGYFSWLGDLLDNINLGNDLSERQLLIGTAITSAFGSYLVIRC